MTELWKIKCKTDLYELHANEAAVQSIPEQIALERERMTSIKSASSGATPVQGGSSRFEDKMNNSICLIDLLNDNLALTKKDIELAHKALATLSAEENRILEVLYIERQKKGAARLCEELGIAEEATVWKKATRALERYCNARYGGKR